MDKNGEKKPAQADSPDRKAAKGRVDPKFQAEIGKQLRALYDEVVKEPIPDRFVELLDRLDSSSEEKQ